MSYAKMKRKRSLLFVDDDPKAFRVKGTLSKHGFDFTGLSDPYLALEFVQDNPLDLVAVDLKMPRMNGVELAREIRKIRPAVPIVVFSAHLHEEHWDEKARESDVHFDDRFEKPFPVDEERIEDFCERLHGVINRSRADGMNDSDNMPSSDPFTISFREYLQVSDEMARQIRRRAWDSKREWLDEQLQQHNWNWVVLCEDKIVLSSSNGGPVPTWKELEPLGETYDRIPFLFVKPPIIEESDWKADGRRLFNGVADYYPRIKCLIEHPRGNIQDVEGDFDSGSNVTCLSSDIVPFDRNDQLQSGSHLGKTFWFALKYVPFSIIDEAGSQVSANLPINIIEESADNPFRIVNPNRVMLFGRDVLNSIPMRIILDSKTRKTFIDL